MGEKIMIREIDTELVKLKTAELFISANKNLPCDILKKVSECVMDETNELASEVLKDVIKNSEDAKRYDIPVCQDTGMAVVFLEVGQDVHFVGKPLEQAINEGVALGYETGYLRKSVVSDPIERINTNDNTPAIIYTRIVPGDKVRITAAPKGFGSENLSKIFMLNPSATREDIIEKIVSAVKDAGSNACPPMVVGVGIGGDFEYSAILSKRALLRDIYDENPDEYYQKLESDILDRVNALDIGPQGFGGKTTALKVNIEHFATHIAGLPVAVNIGCHVTRHCSDEI